MSRVIVAGGAGFIGSHLCERLVENGESVLSIDDYSTGNIFNIKHLLDHPAYDIAAHEEDVVDGCYYHTDKIFNLACPASPKHYQAEPIHTMMTNVVGTRNLLRNARSFGATMVQASTSEIYGDPLVHPQPEDYFGNVNPIGPRSCYDEGKRAAETLCRDYAMRYGVNVKIARIFNTYGPRMAIDDGRVVSNFIVAALRGEPLKIYGDGSRTRSLCYVSDTVEALIRLSNVEYKEVVNVGNPHEITILELAELVLRLTKSSSGIQFESELQDDPHKRKPDITKARDMLGWEPKVNLVDGLERTIEYFRGVI